MATDGLDAFGRLSAFRSEVVAPALAIREGDLVKTAGDGMIAADAAPTARGRGRRAL